MRITNRYFGTNPSRSLIFVHGYTGNTSTWEDWIGVLRSTKFVDNVHIVEYDSTTAPVEDWAVQLIGLLLNDPGVSKKLPVLFIGHSMGAAVIRHAWLRGYDQWWHSPDQHDFLFFAPADSGAKKLLEIQGRPTGFWASCLQVISNFIELTEFNNPAYADLSGQTDCLLRLKAESSRFKPALGVFIADSDVIVNNRLFNPKDPVRIIPFTNHSTITKCTSPASDVFREFGQAVTLGSSENSTQLDRLNVWDRLRRVFYERSGAKVAGSLLVRGELYFSGDFEDTKRKLMRLASQDDPVVLFGEQTCRDLLDRLVELIALCEIALACNLVSLEQINTLLTPAIARDPIFKEYFTKTYPVELAIRFVHRTDGKGSDCSISPDHFNRFLDNVESISGSSDIQFFFRLLDSFRFGQDPKFDLSVLLDSLSNETKVQPFHESMTKRAYSGLGDYIEALAELNELIDEVGPDGQYCSKLFLQFHDYWLERLAPIAPLLRKVVNRFSGKEAKALRETLDNLDSLLSAHRALRRG